MLLEDLWIEGRTRDALDLTTLLNTLVNLQGLWVKHVRFEGPAPVIDVRRGFRLLTCPEWGITWKVASRNGPPDGITTTRYTRLRRALYYRFGPQR